MQRNRSYLLGGSESSLLESLSSSNWDTILLFEGLLQAWTNAVALYCVDLAINIILNKGSKWVVVRLLNWINWAMDGMGIATLWKKN